VLFEPSDLGIRAADGHRDELASVHNRPQQRLDLRGNSGPVVRHDDPFAARSRQTPGAVGAAHRQLELETVPLEQEVARVVAGRRRLVATARSDLRQLESRGTSRLDAVPEAAVLNDDRVRRETNRGGKRRVDQHELGTDRAEIF
jgi:hypothetical protein